MRSSSTRSYLAKLVLPGRQSIPAWATIGVGKTGGVDWIKHATQLVLALIAVSWVAWAYASHGGANSGAGRATGY